MNKVTDRTLAASLRQGTSLLGKISRFTFANLRTALGEPTFEYERFEMDGTHKEWVIEWEGEIYVIYDWNSDLHFTESGMLLEWNVGTTNGLKTFLPEIEKMLNNSLLNQTPIFE